MLECVDKSAPTPLLGERFAARGGSGPLAVVTLTQRGVEEPRAAGGERQPTATRGWDFGGRRGKAAGSTGWALGPEGGCDPQGGRAPSPCARWQSRN